MRNQSICEVLKGYKANLCNQLVRICQKQFGYAGWMLSRHFWGLAFLSPKLTVCVSCWRKTDWTAFTSASNCRQLLPFILHEKITKTKSEIEGWPVFIIFHGTTHLCMHARGRKHCVMFKNSTGNSMRGGWGGGRERGGPRVPPWPFPLSG